MRRAMDMYTIAAAFPGALVGLTCWSAYLSRTPFIASVFPGVDQASLTHYQYSGVLIIDHTRILTPLYRVCMAATPASNVLLDVKNPR